MPASQNYQKQKLVIQRADMCAKAVENATKYGFLDVRDDAEAATWPDPFVGERQVAPTPQLLQTTVAATDVDTIVTPSTLSAAVTPAAGPVAIDLRAHSTHPSQLQPMPLAFLTPILPPAPPLPANTLFPTGADVSSAGPAGFEFFGAEEPAEEAPAPLVGAEQPAEGAAPAPLASGEKLSAYEAQRQANIKRNSQVLDSLGLGKKGAPGPEQEKPPTKQRTKKPRDDTRDGRQLRQRTSPGKRPRACAMRHPTAPRLPTLGPLFPSHHSLCTFKIHLPFTGLVNVKGTHAAL